VIDRQGKLLVLGKKWSTVDYAKMVERPEGVVGRGFIVACIGVFVEGKLREGDAEVVYVDDADLGKRLGHGGEVG
jgi:type I restriction-modification system DNA methylase subunit